MIGYRIAMMKKIKAFFKNLITELKDKWNLLIFLIVLIVMYMPAWLPLLLGTLFKSAALIGIGSAVAVFWAGPFTPFFPLCVAITFAIRKIINKIKKKKAEAPSSDGEKAEESTPSEDKQEK